MIAEAFIFVERLQYFVALCRAKRGPHRRTECTPFLVLEHSEALLATGQPGMLLAIGLLGRLRDKERREPHTNIEYYGTIYLTCRLEYMYKGWQQRRSIDIHCFFSTCQLCGARPCKSCIWVWTRQFCFIFVCSVFPSNRPCAADPGLKRLWRPSWIVPWSACPEKGQTRWKVFEFDMPWVNWLTLQLMSQPSKKCIWCILYPFVSHLAKIHTKFYAQVLPLGANALQAPQLLFFFAHQKLLVSSAGLCPAARWWLKRWNDLLQAWYGRC